MITYTRFDDKGRYTSAVTGLTDDLLHENAARIYLGIFPGFDHYHDIANNAPVAMPASPGPNYAFDYSAKQWVDPRSLADIKAATWVAIKTARETAIYMPLVLACGTFNGDPIGQAKIANTAQYAQALIAVNRIAAIVFTLADNTDITLDAPGMASVGLALGDRTQAIRAIARVLRTQIDAANTADALALIIWPKL